MNESDTKTVITIGAVALGAALLAGYMMRRRTPVEVDVGDLSALKYWCQKLGLTEDQVRTAVSVVGPVVNNVARHLGVRLTGEGASELR